MPGGGASIKPNTLDSAGESQQLKHANAPPVEVNFVPAQTVPGRGRMSMMIVVPSFTKRQQRYPPTVPRVIVGLEALRAPHMGGRIDQPCRMQCQGSAKENAPEHYLPPTEHEQQQADYN